MDALVKAMADMLTGWNRKIGMVIKRGISEGINPPMDCVLKMIDVPLTMTELSKRMLMPKQQMTKIADKLICLGLAQRMADERDRRIVRLSLTDSGREYVVESRKRIMQVFQDMVDGVEMEDQNRLLDAMQTIDAILNKANQQTKN